MPIPPWTSSGVLPPFVGETPTDPAQVAPYAVRFSELADRFGTTPQRWQLVQGLAAYRAELRATNVRFGFQWIDGSFLEAVESLRGRPPADIDVVSFMMPPSEEGPREWFERHANLLRPTWVKGRYRCDGYVVDLSLGARRPELLVDQVKYWYGLFSHQRASQLWKGMLHIDLFSDDDVLGNDWLPKEVDHVAQA